MSATETTQAPDALRPVSCAHEAYQGQCAHCGVPIVNGFPKYPAVQPAAGREVLPTDEGGCVTKRFVIFNTPNRVPEKKGGWLKDEHLIDFLRDVVLHDGWEPGFRATVLELTWDNDLWASSASEYLSLHDHAIGPRAARKAWKAAREKHERIYKAAPAAKFGEEIDSFRKRTALSTPAQASGEPVKIARHALNRIYLGHTSSPKEEARLALDDMDRVHPPAQASETGGERWSFLKARVDTLVNILAPDQGEMLTEDGRRLFAIASAIQSDLAALSAPQAAPGEGEQS